MAGCDYRSCDVCGSKAFYDANLSYDYEPPSWNPEQPPFRIAGEPQYSDPEMNHKHGMRLGYLGDWAVICEDCAKTHKCVIVPIDAAREAKS